MEIKFEDKKVIYAENVSPWRFKTSDKKDFNANLVLTENETTEGNVDFSLCCYKNSDETVIAKRLCFSDNKNIAFIIDVIKSSEDICVYTDFAIENKDLSASVNVADKSKLVIRKSDCAAKHFKLHSEIDGESILEKGGLMMPAEIKKNGDIVYSMYDGLYSFGKEHINCFGIATDTLSDIIYWHLNKTDRGYIIEPPSKSGGIEIEILDDCVNLYDCLTGECAANIEF